MATITSRTGARSWGTATDWVGDVKPADDDLVVIAADCQMLMNEDLSAFTGLRTVTISGHATTPGMLYWKDGTSGHLKIKTGYNLLGTSGAAKGRLLANSDGVWGNTGSLAFADKAVIDLGATSKIDAPYLDIALYCYQPTTKYLRTFGVRHTVTGSAAANTLTKNSHGLANSTPLMIMGADIPAPLVADQIYYVVTTATNTFQLAYTSGGAAIDLTSDGSGTIEVYTGAASGADPVSVFEDVSAETGWTATDGHDRVMVVDAGPVDYDQQRLTITTLDTNHIHLSAALDSLQYPGARIYLSSRNVSIRSACVTSVNIVDFTGALPSASVLQCEIVATAGTGTTFYGYGVRAGVGHTISGTIMGATYGVGYGIGHTISGAITGCATGIQYGGGHTISGAIAGCGAGINAGIGHTISGAIAGCGAGINGSALKFTGGVSGCTYIFRFNDQYDGGGSVYVSPSAILPSALTFQARNAVNIGTLAAKQGFFMEDYNHVLGASYAAMVMGDLIKNTSIIRSSGAVSSIEVIPLSNCSVNAPIEIFEWTELSVPASAQNKSVYLRADAAWSVYPTNTELYVEAEYISNGTTFATTIVKSTAVLSDGSTWVQFTIPEFTPAVAGHVRYRAYLKKYEAARKIYVDNMLVSA